MAPKKQAGQVRHLMRWTGVHRIETTAIAGGVIIIAFCLLTKAWSTPEVWAGWGQWIGGLGTIAAVAVALVIARGETRRAATERQRRSRERTAEKREAQLASARLITAEITLTDESSIPPGHSVTDYPDFTVTITNRGLAHILDPQLDALIPKPTNSALSWTIPNLDDGPLAPYLGPPAVLSVGGTDTIPVNITNSKPTPGQWPSSAIISYTTADGIRWRRRGPGGEPTRVSEDDAFPAEGPAWYRGR